MRPARKLGVRVQLDDEPPKDTQLDKEEAFDAQREVRLYEMRSGAKKAVHKDAEKEEKDPEPSGKGIFGRLFKK